MKNWPFDPKTPISVFLRSNTHFSKNDTHFFVSELICYMIYHFPIRNTWTLWMKNWPFDPKNHVSVILRSNAHFFKSDTHFFVSELICYMIHHFP